MEHHRAILPVKLQLKACFSAHSHSRIHLRIYFRTFDSGHYNSSTAHAAVNGNSLLPFIRSILFSNREETNHVARKENNGDMFSIDF